ncbi:probable 26S proteasome regulatory subunit p27 [[Candida] railenensis]|uniref:Probable 26S proteasome regulatory subunit p27 n=1 Tax=[Candida] railenensis TaxID=45579 RepID=A0A9P0QLT4_9ASCO|nr:probable 26S proteasome regulatory subunit p27 [[Candida] railenensis]
MTLDSDKQSDDAFRGLMKNLNLDETQFKSYVTDFAQLTFDQLVATKSEIEAQLGVLFDILKSNYKADMDTQLVVDGFPRADIDVVGIRLVRVKIIRLRNDLKSLIGLLEEKLVEQFSKTKQEPQSASVDPSGAENTATSPEDRTTGTPFATVNLVVKDGPAFQSGLREGDRLIWFRNVGASTENKLSHISVITKSSLDRAIEVVVSREVDGTSKVIVLHLVPTEKWEGKGVLGCQIKVD